MHVGGVNAAKGEKETFEKIRVQIITSTLFRTPPNDEQSGFEALPGRSLHSDSFVVGWMSWLSPPGNCPIGGNTMTASSRRYCSLKVIDTPDSDTEQFLITGPEDVDIGHSVGLHAPISIR